MHEITVTTCAIPKSHLLTVLKSNNIGINEYAKTYMNHSRFQTEGV